VQRVVQGSRRLGALRPRRDPIRAVALGALRFERSGGGSAIAGFAVARGADRDPAVPFAEQGEVLALLKRDEWTSVARTAGGGQVAPVHGARRVSTIEDVSMGDTRFEGRGITAVALLTSHVALPVSGTVPVRQVIRGRSIRP